MLNQLFNELSIFFTNKKITTQITEKFIPKNRTTQKIISTFYTLDNHSTPNLKIRIQTIQTHNLIENGEPKQHTNIKVSADFKYQFLNQLTTKKQNLCQENICEIELLYVLTKKETTINEIINEFTKFFTYKNIILTLKETIEEIALNTITEETIAIYNFKTNQLQKNTQDLTKKYKNKDLTEIENIINFIKTKFGFLDLNTQSFFNIIKKLNTANYTLFNVNPEFPISITKNNNFNQKIERQKNIEIKINHMKNILKL